MWKVVHRADRNGKKSRIKEHKRDVVHNRIDKTAVVEHVNQNKEHNINFNVKMLSKELHYEKLMIKEAIEMEKCSANFNREDN